METSINDISVEKHGHMNVPAWQRLPGYHCYSMTKEGIFGVLSTAEFFRFVKHGAKEEPQ